MSNVMLFMGGSIGGNRDNHKWLFFLKKNTGTGPQEAIEPLVH